MKQEIEIEKLREIIKATDNNPICYYNVSAGRFNWISALRENNPEYHNKLYEVDSIWNLYWRLSERSVLDKAMCFEWFVDFFGDYIKYDTSKELYNGYIQNFNGELEMILYLRPHQIKVLTEGYTMIETSNLPQLSSAAAGLIRLGIRKEGMALYQKVFEMGWERRATSEDRKQIMDAFLARLAKGYDNEPYIDSEISELLEKQCERFTDDKWVEKIKISLGRNGL